MVATAKPRSSRSATGGIRYLTEGTSHDAVPGKPRSWFVDGAGCMPETADAEWAEVRRKFGKDGTRVKTEDGEPVLNRRGEPVLEGSSVQAVHLVLSYDRSEYDPEDPEAIERAHRQSLEVLERIRAGHQAIAATQTDGVSGLVHTHLYLNAIHPETGRSISGRHPARDINKHRRIVDEVAREHGFENSKLMAERSSERVSAAGVQRREAGQYVWADDLHERLDRAMAEATSRDQWREAAAEQGVEVRFRGKTGVSFSFTDAEGTERRVRGRQVGSRWMAKGIDEQLTANVEKQRVKSEEDQWSFEVKADDYARHDEPGRGTGGVDRGSPRAAGGRPGHAAGSSIDHAAIRQHAKRVQADRRDARKRDERRRRRIAERGNEITRQGREAGDDGLSL